MKIPISELREKIVKTLSQNFETDEVEKITDYLLWAEMSGNSTQGILKLTGGAAMQDIKAEHEVRVDRDTKLSQLINAGQHPAPFASQVATDVLIEKVKENGFGIVGVHNIFSSNGAQAFYAEKIAQEGYIGIVMARSPSSVAAFGGIEPIFGTNPLGVAFPTNEEPLVFDMATSAMTWYGLVLAQAQGKPLPENMAIDKEGNPTTDPQAAMDGALLPFDHSYKGSGLGMVVETLAGPLVGAAYGQLDGEWGALFIAIDPELLVGKETFKANCSELVRKMKSVRKASGVEQVRLPGEHARSARKTAEEAGVVDIDEAVLKQLGYA